MWQARHVPDRVDDADLRDALARIVGDADVLVDDDVRASYETDWTGRWSGRAALVVRPGSTHEVAAVLAHCNRAAVPVVTQGGNTGLVGGGVPRAVGTPAVVLSTRRLRAVGDVDVGAGQVTLGAAVTIAEWRDIARRHGLDAPIDFAARDSATIGGAIATNAGGSRVVRYGTMRQQVTGIEAALADGSIVGSLSGLPKETVGLHWPSLLAGSEGTLGVVTAARLRLIPHFRHVTTALVALDSIDAAVALLATMRSALSTLDAVELILPSAVDLVDEHLARRSPVPAAGVQLLVECADHVDASDALLAVLAGSDGIVDSAIATGGPAREALVERRDRITEAIAAAATESGVPTLKLDVAVPVASLAALIDVAADAASATGARLVAFGHLAEGNVHLNYLGAADATDATAIAERVLPSVAELGGTISAEHGVGVAKSRWMHLVRTPAELAAMSAIRDALDPRHVLNPGVLEPPAPIARR